MPVSPSSSGGGGGSGTSLYPGATSHPLSSLLSQQRLLELSRFGLRHYDIAHHVLSQQGAVTKLLGKRVVDLISLPTLIKNTALYSTHVVKLIIYCGTEDIKNFIKCNFTFSGTFENYVSRFSYKSGHPIKSNMMWICRIHVNSYVIIKELLYKNTSATKCNVQLKVFLTYHLPL